MQSQGRAYALGVKSSSVHPFRYIASSQICRCASIISIDEAATKTKKEKKNVSKQL